jgi:AcrR family transcriptional regulator
LLLSVCPSPFGTLTKCTQGPHPETALGLLAESGAHDLTQSKVSRAAGVRQSHLTYYLPTRADLLQEVARHSVEKLAGELAAERAHSPAHVAEKIAPL